MINTIPTRSNIQIIAKETFLEKTAGFKEIDPNENTMIVRAPHFYTSDIRTCAAGGFTAVGETPVGFHYLDWLPIFKRTDELVNKVITAFKQQPDSGVLLGSKNLLNDEIYKSYNFSEKVILEGKEEHKYSIPFFTRIKEIVQKQVPNLSIFENHKIPTAQSQYAYSMDENTHYITAEYIPAAEKKLNYINIKNYQELKDFYSNIQISKNHNLFINGKRVKGSGIIQFFFQRFKK